MTTYQLLLLFIAFNIKHLVVDFLLQGPYQWMNKGTYGHPGGILHSGLHGAVTGLILAAFPTVPVVIAILWGLVDTFVHYHIDWAKVNINKRMGWGPTTHPQFWFLLGWDQFFHWLTYIAIAAAVI